MKLKYLPNGNLIPGIHSLSWEIFVEIYGYTQRRRDLIEGLALAIEHLSACGCTVIYVDGSFVTKERNPGDYDACWDDKEISVDHKKLSKMYRELHRGSRDEQHLMYKGDVKPFSPQPDWRYDYFHYFTHDKFDDSEKGIIQLSF